MTTAKTHAELRALFRSLNRKMANEKNTESEQDALRRERDAVQAKIERLEKRQEEQIAVFLGTLQGQTKEEALANLESDARAYGWSREAVRKAAGAIRLRYGVLKTLKESAL